jgi:hypothetical protein
LENPAFDEIGEGLANEYLEMMGDMTDPDQVLKIHAKYRALIEMRAEFENRLRGLLNESE